ncbi:NAD(P)H-hydrate dehydratase [Xylocopilactobacillus apicola]|uniref:ADP-dependent (S)-NAD(P)H-hydrate dehydratase n=1 Tax=Xylocopilactobacillus apicola TaxID=2932184 RepID=A0AAU9CWZ5_9LACO|nr:NAD(P)H-hydrate dehydratase [Xylocopilactobacillus apicola]BDR58499.1 ADP-dependent (S)-NAD(P)H-hydrate dehydratase [Xylocopilactobacillus apicola]
MKQIAKEILHQVIKPRNPDTHKYNYGRVLFIGGNQHYGGAAIMSAQAAVNSGAGLVTVACDPINLSSLHSVVPEAVFQDYNDQKSLETIFLKSDVISIGSGLGTEAKSLSLLKMAFELVDHSQILIIDGSAFSLLADNQLNLPPASLILTPHQGEWQRYSGLQIDDQSSENNQKVLSSLSHDPATLVLKKHRTEIYYGNMVWQNTSGNASMATAGMGDTLAGMIAGFVAQFSNHVEAVLAAVYLHGSIGDKLAQKQYVTTPSEIVKQISAEMKSSSI